MTAASEAVARKARLTEANRAVRSWTWMSTALIAAGVGLIGSSVFGAHIVNAPRIAIAAALIAGGFVLSVMGARRKVQYLRDHRGEN
jgi:small neutral amino acid transporter SnatA (MarC family)